MMISYAQNHEDVLLARLFPRGLNGFYIDIGANEPVKDSVTKHFYDLGWHGINIEPAAGPFSRLAEERDRDLNINVGMSDQDGTLTLHEFPLPSTGASTFSASHAAWLEDAGYMHEKRSVPVTTLRRICEEHVNQPIDFLSIDVEGHERQVLVGADWKRWRPRVVVIEATQPQTTIPTHELWQHLLLDADYLFATFDGLNRYYVRAEDSVLLPAFSTPVNVLDEYIAYDYLSSQRELTASRVVNQSLRTQYQGLPEALESLQMRCARVERALATSRERFRDMSVEISEARTAYDRLVREVTEVRAGTEALFQGVESVGPLGLGVAHQLRRLSIRAPRTAQAAGRALRQARALQKRLERGGDGGSQA